MIQVEFEVSVVFDVILLVHEIGDELEVRGCSGARVVAGDGDLGIGQHLHLDVETFRGEGIVVVCFMELRRILQITHNYVPNPVVVTELLPVDVLPLLRAQPVEFPLGRSWDIVYP